MKLSLWRMVISLRDDIGRILERTLLPGMQGSERTVLQNVDLDALGQLRGELRNRLDSLKDALSRELTENETYLVMFPLVLLCDEMVMGRLPKQQHTEWKLLQHELFQINYGGDVFYDFVDERLGKPDTPPMVFEVLYFCLSAGFVGKFGFDSGKVQRYRALLAERIPGALTPARKLKKRRRERPSPEGAEPAEGAEGAEPGTGAGLAVPSAAPGGQRLAVAALYYGAALGAIVVAVLLVLLFTNV